MEEMHDCTICFEGIEDPSQLVKTPCGHTFHNSCLTPWFMAKDTCPMCRCNYGDGQENDDYDYNENVDLDFTVRLNFRADSYIMGAIQRRIAAVYSDPDEETKDWLVNYINGERVLCVYSLINNYNSIIRFDFEYNKERNRLEIFFISEQMFNENEKYRVLNNWVFKRRANGYFNYNITEF